MKKIFIYLFLNLCVFFYIWYWYYTLSIIATKTTITIFVTKGFTDNYRYCFRVIIIIHTESFALSLYKEE